jgi:hypothetical protein
VKFVGNRNIENHREMAANNGLRPEKIIIKLINNLAHWIILVFGHFGYQANQFGI